MMREEVPALRKLARLMGRHAPVFFHPRHVLGDEIAANIRADYPLLRVASYRGMTAANPDKPGHTMCGDPELVRLAVEAGMAASETCAFCPLAEKGCAYIDQRHALEQADVVVTPHQTLFLTPFTGWPRVMRQNGAEPKVPGAIIVDESIVSAGLAGMERGEPGSELALSSLRSRFTGPLKVEEAARLLELRAAAATALEGMGDGGVWREPLVAAGLARWGKPKKHGQVQMVCFEWAKLEAKCRPKHELRRDTPRETAIATLARNANSGYVPLLQALAARLGAFLEQPNDARSVNVELESDVPLGAGKGTGRVLRFSYRRDIHEGWGDAPIVFLDGTARPEVLRHWAEDLVVEDVEVAAPNQYVVQVSDREFSRKQLVEPGKELTPMGKRVADLLLVELSRSPGPMLAVMQLDVERAMRDELLRRGITERIPNVFAYSHGRVLCLAHYGGVTGSNAWQDAATVVTVGRPAVNRRAAERQAAVIAGRAVETLAAEDGRWLVRRGGLRLVDGTGWPVERQPYHPDPLVEALRWEISEGAVMQAIGRGRGVRREPSRPLRVVVLAALALPLTVHETPRWSDVQPDRLAVAAALAKLTRRALPLAPADLVAAWPDLWPSVAAAERSFERGKTPQALVRDLLQGDVGFYALRPASYRRGAAKRWSLALVPTEGGEAGARAALVREVGELAAFVLNESGAAAPAPPVATVHVLRRGRA